MQLVFDMHHVPASKALSDILVHSKQCCVWHDYYCADVKPIAHTYTCHHCSCACFPLLGAKYTETLATPCTFGPLFLWVCKQSFVLLMQQCVTLLANHVPLLSPNSPWTGV